MKASQLLLSAAICVAPTCVSAQEWEYVAYSPDGTPRPGSITLEEKDGQATFQMIAQALDRCLKAPLKAAVERSATHVTITPQPRFQDCSELQFFIKLDGSGGVLRRRNNATWVDDSRDRKLTLIK